MLEIRENIGEFQVGFRPSHDRADFVYTSGKLVRGEKDAGLTTQCGLQADGMNKWAVD